MNPALSDIQIQFPVAKLLSCRTFNLKSFNKNYPFRLAASSVTIPQQTCSTLVVRQPFIKLPLKARAQVATWVGPQELAPPMSCGLKPKRKRASPVKVRLSQSEKEFVRQKAQRAKISLNAFIKHLILGADYDPTLRNALLNLNREFTFQGNNLNQIARQLNGNIITQSQGNSLLDLLGRSMLQTHKRIRQALSHGQTED